MDITERKITKIAREAEKLVLLSMREEGVGTAEIDLIHALRHHPGCTQARLAEMLHADKAADRRSRLLYPTEKAEAMKASKTETEAAFYAFLLSALTAEERKTFAALLDTLYVASKTESRAGFPHLLGGKGK